MPNDRILVVDDEETIREIVSSMLGGAHFQTRQAASGIEALAILESGDAQDTANVGRLAALDYFMRYELPKTDAWLRVVEARDRTCVHVPEDAF